MLIDVRSPTLEGRLTFYPTETADPARLFRVDERFVTPAAFLGSTERLQQLKLGFGNMQRLNTRFDDPKLLKSGERYFVMVEEKGTGRSLVREAAVADTHKADAFIRGDAASRKKFAANSGAVSLKSK
ncbi:MAG: hypothetical protein WC829_16895 [Hyphomicrobium sp.]